MRSIFNVVVCIGRTRDNKCLVVELTLVMSDVENQCCCVIWLEGLSTYAESRTRISTTISHVTNERTTCLILG